MPDRLRQMRSVRLAVIGLGVGSGGGQASESGIYREPHGQFEIRGGGTGQSFKFSTIGGNGHTCSGSGILKGALA